MIWGGIALSCCRWYVLTKQLNVTKASELVPCSSPLEFNAIFRDSFPLRLDLTAGSKIRDPVTAKFKHAQLL